MKIWCWTPIDDHYHFVKRVKLVVTKNLPIVIVKFLAVVT